MDDAIVSGEFSRSHFGDLGEGEDAIINGAFVRRNSGGGARKNANAIQRSKEVRKYKSSESQGFHQLLESLAHVHDQQDALLDGLRDENGKLRARLRDYKERDHERLGRQSSWMTGKTDQDTDLDARSQKTEKSGGESDKPPSPQPPNGGNLQQDDKVSPFIDLPGCNHQEPEKSPPLLLGVLPGCQLRNGETDFGIEHTRSPVKENPQRALLQKNELEWLPVESCDEVVAHSSDKGVVDKKSSLKKEAPLDGVGSSRESKKPAKLQFDLEEAMQEIEDVDALEGHDSDDIFYAPGNKPKLLRCDRTLTEELHTFTIYKQWELEASRLQRRLSRNRSNLTWGQYKNSTHILGAGSWLQKLIISPNSPKRVAWDIVGMLLLAYDMIFIPLNALQPGDLVLFNVMDWVTLLFWTTDMAASLITGYVDQGVTITNPKKIMRHYVRSWFVLDLCVVVPDWVFTLIGLFSGDSNSSGDLGKFLRTLRAVRTVRLLRLAKLKHLLSLLRDRIDSEYMFIVSNVQKMMLLLLLVNHFIGCGWYWIGTLTQGSGLKSWINRYEQESFTNRYFTCLHWSLSQFTPGSMDVQPMNAAERIFAVCCLIVGLVMMAWFISSITASMAQMRSLQGERPRQMWLLRRFLRQHHVDSHLIFRIQRYMEYACAKTESVVNESKITIIHLLSDQLLDELHYTVKFGCMQDHPLFEWAVNFSPKTMFRLCRRTLLTQSLAPNDILFQNGKACGNMYFVTQGCVRYVKGEEQTLEQVDHEDWLCEPALWTQWVHMGEARAVKESSLVIISVAAFGKEMLQDVPLHMKMSEYAKLYVHWLNEESLDDLSDVSAGYEQKPIVTKFLEKNDMEIRR